MNPPLNLMIHSLVSKNSSLGNIGYLWAKYFQNNPGYNVCLMAWKESADIKNEFSKILNKGLPAIDVWLRNCDPAIAFESSKATNCAFIPFVYYDNKNINKEIVYNINKYTTALVVPSKFTRNRFLKFGVKIPIEVIGNPVDLQVFKPIQKCKPPTFTFINYGEQSQRKGTDILLKAFQEEFKNDQNIILELLVSNQYFVTGLVPKDVNQNVHISIGRISQEELVHRINLSDCFVAFTREDSFGMCGLESMACGLPVIASKDSGYSEYVNSSNGFSVNCSLSKHPVYEYEPDLEHCKIVLREAVNQWKNNFEDWQKKQTNAILTAEKYNYLEFGSKFDSLIKKLKNLTK